MIYDYKEFPNSALANTRIYIGSIKSDCATVMSDSKKSIYDINVFSINEILQKNVTVTDNTFNIIKQISELPIIKTVETIEEEGKKFNKWKIDKLISFHTSSVTKEAAYADWFSPKEIERISGWVTYLA